MSNFDGLRAEIARREPWTSGGDGDPTCYWCGVSQYGGAHHATDCLWAICRYAIEPETPASQDFSHPEHAKEQP
jgi:hypothetical protein